MKRAKVLYHVTPEQNVKSILEVGLIPGGIERDGSFVHLSTKPTSWYMNGLVTLEVETDGLENIKATTFLPESDEVLFWGKIPPENIRVHKE